MFLILSIQSFELTGIHSLTIYVLRSLVNLISYQNIRCGFFKELKECSEPFSYFHSKYTTCVIKKKFHLISYQLYALVKKEQSP